VKQTERRYEWLYGDELFERIEDYPLAWLPLGILEKHGGHLPWGLDGLKAHAVCMRLAVELGGVVLPANHQAGIHGDCREADVTGFRQRHAQVGDLLYREESFRTFLTETFDGLANLGFRVIVAYTGHYPTVQTRILQEAAEAFTQTSRAHVITFWEELACGGGDHAGKWETSIYLALDPDAVRLDAIRDESTGQAGYYRGQDVASHTSHAFGRDALAQVEAYLTAAIVLHLPPTSPTTASDEPFPIQTLPPGQVARELLTDASGMFPASRTISTISAVVVRRDNPDGPQYQEALGYQFLINNAKFPGLTRLDDGRLVLTLTATAVLPASEASAQSTRDVGLVLFSGDDGMSWSPPQRIGIYRCTPVNLGGDSLLLRGYPVGHSDATDTQSLCLSDDAGTTWSELQPVPTLPDGRPASTDVALHPLVENGRARFVFYAPLQEDDPARRDGIRTQTVIYPFDFGRASWEVPTFLPVAWRTSEGSIVRTQDGTLAGAFRTSQPAIPELSDHWRGILTSHSTDDGRTWAEPTVHSLYGHVHTHESAAGWTAADDLCGADRRAGRAHVPRDRGRAQP